MNKPLVTVGIPLYRHEAYIEECLASITTQSYQNIEIIVIDDGSPDDSFNVAKRYLDSQIHNKNFKIITRPNKGMCNTLNEIAQLAQGKYLSITASDDYWASDKIEDQVNFLELNPDNALVHSNSIKVDGNKKHLKHIDYSDKKNSGKLYEAMIFGEGGINTPSTMFKTSIFEDIGYYDPEFSFEDTDFWLRLTKHHKVGYINKFHTYYRWHGNNISNDKNAFIFFHQELERIYLKNIDEPNLRKHALTKLYKKSIRKAVNSVKLKTAWQYFLKLIKLNKELAS